IENKELDSDYGTLIAVTVRGSGGNISINETKRVVLKRYDSLTFVQTDKAVYKPGQTVKFRIVTLNENFVPIQEKYPFVTVWDPESNRIGQWRDVEPRQGIVDLTFDLMPEPMKGTYRIEVLKNKGKRDHDFSVQERNGIPIQAFAMSEIVTEITKITFEEMEGYFRKDLQYTGQIRMQYSTGGPISNATIYLFNSLKPGAEKVSTDENGIASFSLDTSSWGSRPVAFTAIYQGQYQGNEYRNTLPHHQSAHHLVKPFYSRSNSYLAIRKHGHDLACDSELDVNVDYIIKALSAQEKHNLDVFYLVMSRGLIMTFEKKTISVGGSEGTKGHLHFSLPINADISPVARLLVFAVLPDGETIGDSAKFQVSKCFRNKVSLHFSVAEDLPKSHVNLDVHAAPDSLCGLRVVDRSVLLLKPEKELSRDSVYSLLPVRDLSGYNYRVNENALEFCRRQDPWSEPVPMDNAIGEFNTLIQVPVT
ncbi:hypothetical protein scyTo_0015205, partial [Scyliorhinus torazame]|nr:hypothetical protein [Scyliorhinus torazame]